MPLNRENFQKFEDKLFLTLQGKNPMEVPYFICLYHPKDEMEVMDTFSNLALRIKNKGFTVETFFLSKMMIEILSKFDLLSFEILDKEEQIREDLGRDLKRILSDEMVEVLKERLRDKDVHHCAILLRYGALWPFVHLSYIFQSIDGIVNCTIVVPYPSDIEIGYNLNEKSKDVIDHYRAERVDLR